MNNVIIIQRLVPHYRLPLFERLWKEFGWIIVTAKNPPANTKLNLIEREVEFIKRYDFEFPDARNTFKCKIPLQRILAETRAGAVISEFSLRMDSTYKLIARRRLWRGPVILFWSHGFNMELGMDGLRQIGMQWIRGKVSALGDGHVCYGEDGREFLTRFMPKERLFVARNTIDIGPLQELAQRVTPVASTGRPRLLTVGRITADKDFPRLVRVFHKLRADLPDATLTIIGDGPDAERTRVAAGDQLGKSITMVGALYDEETLASYFLSTDLVVFAGAVGLSVNHALAYGVPVAAYDRTPSGPHHHPEITYVQDDVTGLRVSPFTEEAMLQALRQFFSDYPDPKAVFHDRIRDHVSENMTLDNIVKDFGVINNYLDKMART